MAAFVAGRMPKRDFTALCGMVHYKLTIDHD